MRFSVSRQSRKCLDLFGLDFQRNEGEWNPIGDSTIFALERFVHHVCLTGLPYGPHAAEILLIIPVCFPCRLCSADTSRPQIINYAET